MKKRLLSGLQPSGQLHLGNYVGAIQQFVRMQDTHEMFVFVASSRLANTRRAFSARSPAYVCRASTSPQTTLMSSECSVPAVVASGSITTYGMSSDFSRSMSPRAIVSNRQMMT